MTVADHHVVGEVGFTAWKSSDAFKGCELALDVVERTRHSFEIFASQTNALVHVGELDGAVVGWGARDGAPNYISDLWVLPSLQGRGIGKALLLSLCDDIRAEGHQTARLDTQARNAGGIRLYERCGFDIVWRGREYSKSMGIELEKVHLEKVLSR